MGINSSTLQPSYDNVTVGTIEIQTIFSSALQPSYDIKKNFGYVRKSNKETKREKAKTTPSHGKHEYYKDYKSHSFLNTRAFLPSSPHLPCASYSATSPSFPSFFSTSGFFFLPSMYSFYSSSPCLSSSSFYFLFIPGAW